MKLGLEKNNFGNGRHLWYCWRYCKKLLEFAVIPIVLDRLNKSEAKWKQEYSPESELHWYKLDLTEEELCSDAIHKIVDRVSENETLYTQSAANSSNDKEELVTAKIGKNCMKRIK